jgi:D-apionolactonase
MDWYNKFAGRTIMLPTEEAAAEGPAGGSAGEDRVRFGTPDGLAFEIDAGPLRGITFGGIEVLRLVDYPIRDADWATLPVKTDAAERTGALGHRRRFRSACGTFRGTFEVDGTEAPDGARVTARLEFVAEREAVVNRAGLVLLHPIAGVAGAPLTVVHADGSAEETTFPRLISPSQPAFDIAGLRHRVGPVAVEISMAGEVFEMEDQRNWTDASFKTYCRPLAWERPYRLAAGDVVRQEVRVNLRRADSAVAGEGRAAAPARARMPEVTLAFEAALTGSPPEPVARLGVAGLLLRVDAADPAIDDAAGFAPVTLEIVTGLQSAADIERVAAACRKAGIAPRRVVGLPRGYLASHQPEGPWPTGPRPDDLVPALRAAFPEAEIGGGMLTNFTEFNRCRPDAAAIDFATFGTTAIVHAADDRSVLETLEALGDVFASARAITGAKPLHLGLVAIGMRSNPYGAAVAPNLRRERLPMAMDDPRQREPFAAAWAVAAAAEVARGGVASFAPAMTGGPIGLGEGDTLWPIFHAVAALAALGGAEVEIAGVPGRGLVVIRGRGRRGVTGLAANLGPAPVEWSDTPALLLDATSAASAAHDPDWIERPGSDGVTIEPMALAILKERS